MSRSFADTAIWQSLTRRWQFDALGHETFSDGIHRMRNDVGDFAVAGPRSSLWERGPLHNEGSTGTHHGTLFRTA